VIRFILGCALAVLPAFADLTGASGAPAYTAAGVVNAATQLAQTLAPNTIATLYGTNLSYADPTSAGTVQGTLPTTLGGVTVTVNGIAANLFYVSATQINFLIPYTITAATAAIFVLRDGTSGPTVTVPLAAAAPAFFEWNTNLVLAVHSTGELISATAPAVPNEVIILFAAGLGRTQPDIGNGQITVRATSLLDLADFRILLNGAPLPVADTWYAGLAPGFSGLYQINLQLPTQLPDNPQIQIAMGQQISPSGVTLTTSQ
jgi:uncharacterized protein (TIGR03437 family)